MRKLNKCHKITFIVGISSGNFKARKLDKDFTSLDIASGITEFEYLMKSKYFRENNYWLEIKDNSLFRKYFEDSDPVAKFYKSTRTHIRSCLTLNQTTSYNHG